MRFVFLHGGPGFNSFAEEAMLGPLFRAGGHEIVFWNEPSRFRPDGDGFEEADAFERWLGSAERCVLRAAVPQRVHVIAHSFTPHAALDIARRHPDRVASLVLIAPAADPLASFRNVLRLASEDLADAKPDVAAAIAGSRARTRAVLDDAMREGLLSVLHDDRLFTHYFAETDQLQATMTARARPEGQFDVDSFFAVLAGFSERGASRLATGPVTVPTLTLFGRQDPITPAGEQQLAIRAAIPGCRVETLDGCSHYLHLDRPRVFVDLVTGWAASLPPRAE